MKKCILFVSTLLIISFTAALSQCVPGTSTNSGITPDSATGLAVAMQGQPYTQVLQIRVPTDTVVEFIPGVPVTVTILTIQLTSFTGLPAGLTYSCTPSNCVFPAGTNGCVEISGTPTTPGTYPLMAIISTTGSFFGQPVIQVDTVDYYVLNVSAATGIAEYNTAGFSLGQNSPNPFSDFSDIDILAPVQTEVEFRIFNMIGKEVYNRQIQAEAGINRIRIDGRDFAPGIYMYTATLSGRTISQRMVVTKK
jgi:hypothetical protein